MDDNLQFPELERDQAAIDRFVEEQNAATTRALVDDQYHLDLARALEVLRDDSYLTGVRRRGAWLYNYLRNKDHPKGLWRRVPADEAPRVESAWQPVFDVDAFCAATGEDWHWRGAKCAFFDSERMLICLSWQGSDQCRYVEWDPLAQAPVPGGFDLGPERNSVSWLDEETVLYSTASLDGAATRSGWPGRVLSLKRGQALTVAEVVFEVGHDDLLGYASTFLGPAGQGVVSLARVRVIGDIKQTLYLEGLGGSGVALETPANTIPSFSTTHYAYLAGEDGPHAPGTLVLKAIGSKETRVLFEPRPYTSVSGAPFVGERWMLWVELDRTVPTLRRLDLATPGAEPHTIPLPDRADALSVYPHDAEPSGDGPFQVVTSGFLAPPKTWLMTLGAQPEEVTFTPLSEEPASFDASGLEVRLESATSDDGTEIPYHIVLPKDRPGPVPVLQYGYGGFGVALSPGYQRLRGPLWLAKGGAYVLAYIRGGAEFGKAWHLAAKGAARPRAFEDFAAVARDLVARGITTPSKIACHGASNGGLLCSVMLTRYPERFGAVWASVAVTDMLRFHLFPAGAAWIDEYGDPDAEADRARLRAYSPLHNVPRPETRACPPALIDTGTSDDRVDPSHSRRLAAALLEAGQRVHFHASAGGHAGGGSLDEQAAAQALGHAFLRQTLKVG
ncbi:MAG: prolyl oligopeptidase family serine peptidase [Pseudomonadota bacterium]